MTTSAGGELPREQLPITLFDSVVLAVRSGDGVIYLSLRDLCDAIGIALEMQRRRIVTNESLHLKAFRVRSGQQIRVQDFLLLDDLTLWILTIQSQRANAAARDKIRYIKQYLEAAVRKAFADLTQLPDAPSATIEDLRELDRIDPALAQLEALGQRQDALEHSQDRARAAFRDVLDALQGLRALPEELAALRQRVQELEQQIQRTITPAQRGTIYQAVQRWGEARAAQQTADQRSVSMRRCWAEFNTRFNLASYSQLPAARYDEALQFIKDQYRTTTGRDLDAVEQSGLDL